MNTYNFLRRKTEKGDVITISPTSSMFCLGRNSKTTVLFVYEEDNSAFVLDRKGKIYGLVYETDYFYELGDNENTQNKISFEVQKNKNNSCGIYFEEGDVIEIYEPSFCLLYGEKKQFQVLHKCANNIPYILLPNGEATSVLKNFKVINKAAKIFDTYWKKRENHQLIIDKRIGVIEKR